MGEAEREIAVRALVREAEEYGADGVVEVAYAVEECRGARMRGREAAPPRRDRPRGEAGARGLRAYLGCAAGGAPFG